MNNTYDFAPAYFLSQDEIPDIRKSPSALGHHIIVDLVGCDAATMESANHMKDIFHIAAEKAGCHIVSEHAHEFEPYGISGVIILSESHISFHSYQEYNYIAIDLFYCSDEVKISKAIEILKDFFSAQYMAILALDRGNLEQLQRCCSLPINALNTP